MDWTTVLDSLHLTITGPESGRLHATISPPKINEAPAGRCEEAPEVGTELRADTQMRHPAVSQTGVSKEFSRLPTQEA